jgi:membrane protein YqaA with SNARE-associated domain
MKRRHVHVVISLLIFLLIVATGFAVWRGLIPIQWLELLGYRGIFVLSLINGVAPFGGPSQVATFFAASKLNPALVGIVAGVGGAFGELVGYFFGYSLRRAQSEQVETKIDAITRSRFLTITRERSFIPLFVLASVPNPIFDPASALAGSLKIGLGRYFFPVLLGKVLRHLVIAYAGYLVISRNVLSGVDKDMLTSLLASGVFLMAVLGIAVVAWVVRSFAESDPDPFLLNLTFFAFAGQCILTGELARENRAGGPVLVLLLFAMILVLFQVLTIRNQATKTLEHYRVILQANHIGRRTSAEIDQWAAVLLRITGVDFYPEFWSRWSFGIGPRAARREQAVSILPADTFDRQTVTADLLTVPTQQRKGLWRAYAIICALSWFVFILCILVAKRHQ